MPRPSSPRGTSPRADDGNNEGNSDVDDDEDEGADAPVGVPVGDDEGDGEGDDDGDDEDEPAGGSDDTPGQYRGNLPVGEGVSALYTPMMRLLSALLLVVTPALADPAAPPSSGSGADHAGDHGADRGADRGAARTADDVDAGERRDDARDDAEDDGNGWVFRCDGTDEALLREIDEAFRTRVGYGETWDESICNEGLMIVGDGVRTGPRKKKIAPAPAATPAVAPVLPVAAPAAPRGPPTLEQRMNDQFFALAIPAMAGVAGVFAIVVAALIGLFLRLKKQVVVDVACPACPTSFPFVVGESPQLFCPACGAACRVDILWNGKLARANAVPL
jgi:hypothetical protein